MTRTAVIIGAGIAGPAAALALQKAGIDPVICERHPAGAEGVGAFLTLASNGLDALDVIGARGPATVASFPTPAITLRSHTGKALGTISTGRSGPLEMASRTIRRGDLYRALIETARGRGIEILHDRRLVGIAQGEDEVEARFADGTTAAGQMVIGCDGVDSTVRRLIDPEAPAPSFAGLLNTGGYATGIKVDCAPGTYEMIFGRRGFFGFVAAPGGEVWWFANLPSTSEEADGRAGLSARLRECFAEDAGPAEAIIGATEELLPLTAVHSLPHLPAWHRGRSLVIGDAAHAPTPSSGQGASLAIEDAVALALCLRGVDDPAAAFARFEALRRKRVEKIIRWAARVNSSKAAGPVGRVLRDAMMPTILRLTADSRSQREVFEYHLDWDAPAPVAA